MSSLNDLIASQDALLREASLALPHEFNRCTYSMGHIKQAIYLCRTCATPRGICAACSIACHTAHDQLELFPKRLFRCDCPTTTIPHACTLHTPTHGVPAPNTNAYGQNFSGLFCRCAQSYDPRTEPETMIQCLACEDWFHESCLHLRTRPPPREPSPDLPSAETDGDDGYSDTSSSCLPLPLITADDYDAFVCAACVRNIPILRRYAGTHGTVMVVRDGTRGSWRRLEDVSEADERIDTTVAPASGTVKRPRAGSPPQDEPESKRPKTTSSPCLAPAVNPVAQAILDNHASASVSGTGDVFLTEGFRERWCRCDQCLPSLQAHPYLLEEEETYDPPEDPDSGLSFEELGTRALERLPRDRAIDGILAFNDMRDELLAYLRPFAQQGKVVEEADVTRFFEALKEKRASVN